MKRIPGMSRRWRGRRRHRGAAAIEFALVFPLFLMIFYAIVGYSLVFVYQQGLHTLSADAVRQAVAVERHQGALDEAAIEAAVQAFIDEDDAHWPASLAALCNPGALVPRTDEVEVCVAIELGLPQLTLPGIDIAIPHLTEVRSTSSIRL